MSDAANAPRGSRPPHGPRQATRWAREGRLHPDSAAIVAGFAPDVSRLLYWWGRGLDNAAELDDTVQMLALAELEARAAPASATGTAFRLTVQRVLRRETWPVTRQRHYGHHWEWDDGLAEQVFANDHYEVEEFGWEDVVSILQWRDGLAVWLWAVEGWTLEEIGALHGLTKQQAWRQVRRGSAVLRRQLALLAP